MSSGEKVRTVLSLVWGLGLISASVWLIVVAWPHPAAIVNAIMGAVALGHAFGKDTDSK